MQTPCHKCKDRSREVYSTRAPTCGQCLQAKVLRHPVFRRPYTQQVLVDYNFNSRLLHYFIDNHMRAPTTDVTDLIDQQVQAVLDTFRPKLLTVNQRRQIATQIRIGVVARLGMRNMIVIDGSNATIKAGRVFERLLAGSLIPFDDRPATMISIFKSLDDSEIDALTDHILHGSPRSLENRMDENWSHGIEPSIEHVCTEFMRRIHASELPGAINNVLATAEKIAVKPKEMTAEEVLCRVCCAKIRPESSYEKWLPTAEHEADDDVCQMCSLAFDSIDLDLVQFTEIALPL